MSLRGRIPTNPIPATTAAWYFADSDESDPAKPFLLPDTLKQNGGRKVVALLAEDNRGDVFLIQEAIEFYDLPIELHVVNDGQKAVQFMEHADNDSKAPWPEVLLLDLNLPKRHGREVLQHVRASRKFKDIPVLIITSSDLPRDREELTLLGANRYFRKPNTYEQFLKVGEVLKELLQASRIH